MASRFVLPNLARCLTNAATKERKKDLSLPPPPPAAVGIEFANLGKVIAKDDSFVLPG
jgi:hypothetical protein